MGGVPLVVVVNEGDCFREITLGLRNDIVVASAHFDGAR